MWSSWTGQVPRPVYRGSKTTFAAEPIRTERLSLLSKGAGVDAVIHFAGLKAVGESLAEPLRCWDVNVTGSRQLLASMVALSLFFSSSATVHGYLELVSIDESALIRPINPYGYIKAALEMMPPVRRVCTLPACAVSTRWGSHQSG